MKSHDYTAAAKVVEKLYNMSQELRLSDSPKVGAAEVAEKLDSLCWELAAYIEADNEKDAADE